MIPKRLVRPALGKPLFGGVVVEVTARLEDGSPAAGFTIYGAPPLRWPGDIERRVMLGTLNQDGTATIRLPASWSAALILISVENREEENYFGAVEYRAVPGRVFISVHD